MIILDSIKLFPKYKSKFISSDIALRRPLTVLHRHHTVQAHHNIQHLLHHIHQVLLQVLAITNILLHRPRLLSVLRTLQPVLCIHLQMLHILLPRFSIHQMLELHNTISPTVPVLQFIRLLISPRWPVQGKLKKFFKSSKSVLINILF